MGIIMMICGVLWVIFALCNRVQNFKSAIFYKAIPFFTGLAGILCAMNEFGWVNIF